MRLKNKSELVRLTDSYAPAPQSDQLSKRRAWCDGAVSWLREQFSSRGVWDLKLEWSEEMDVLYVTITHIIALRHYVEIATDERAPDVSNRLTLERCRHYTDALPLVDIARAIEREIESIEAESRMIVAAVKRKAIEAECGK